MHKLLNNHITKTTTRFRNSHLEIVDQLKSGAITTFNQYKYECNRRSIVHFNRELFDSYIKSKKNVKSKKLSSM